MAIETLNDYNAQAACCCPQTLCPIPEQECESITREVCGYQLPEHPDNTEEENCKRFATRASLYELAYSRDSTTFVSFVEVPYHEDGTLTSLWTDTKTLTGGACGESYEASEIYHYYSLTTLGDGRKYPEITTDGSAVSSTATPAWTGPITSTTYYEDYPGEPPDPGDTSVGDYTDAITPLAGTLTPTGAWTKTSLVYTLLVSTPLTPPDTGFYDETRTVTFSDEIDLASIFEDLSFPDDADGEICESSTDCDTATKARIRWKIPHEWADPVTGLTVAFPGTYFKITYDIVEEPDGWDAPSPTVFRSFVSEDNVLEWNGPGIGSENDDSWRTAWVDIPLPTGKGRCVLANLRLVCREDWGLGVLPQVWGESVTLPDP